MASKSYLKKEDMIKKKWNFILNGRVELLKNIQIAGLYVKWMSYVLLVKY